MRETYGNNHAMDHLLAYFFGGAFLANTVPHLVNGISGSPFQSPFAAPPGQGLSSATVNVLWGMFNLVVAYVLVARRGRFELRQTRHAVAIGLGVLLGAHAGTRICKVSRGQSLTKQPGRLAYRATFPAVCPCFATPSSTCPASARIANGSSGIRASWTRTASSTSPPAEACRRICVKQECPGCGSALEGDCRW